MNPRSLLALFLAGLFALAAIVAVAATRDGADGPVDSSPRGALMPDAVPAPAFELTDERGEPVSMDAFRGSPVIVTFLYTHCEEACPPAAQQVKGALNERGRDVPALAIAVEPERDTPESARAFLADQRMLGRMRFVLGSREELEPVWRAYGVQPQTAQLEHHARIVLVDGEGFQRIGFPVAQATPEAIAHDVRLLEG